MQLKSHGDTLFLTDDPDALAAYLYGRYELASIRPCLNKPYRLTSNGSGMIVAIYANGTVLVQGRQAGAAALLLSDLCQEAGEAA